MIFIKHKSKEFEDFKKCDHKFKNKKVRILYGTKFMHNYLYYDNFRLYKICKYENNIKVYLEYYKNGVYHNEKGPAIINNNGLNLWYYNGVKYNVNSKEELLLAIMIE